jgi:membrane-anchored protein YejM (alkaline phosphatase superfamily)
MKILKFILVVLFLTFNPHICFSKDSVKLSGKYKDCNVILIILDALRPDHLSCYGYTKETSPNIDTLAKQGVIFKNAFCQSPVTMTSVVSIFTSLYPFSHNVIRILKDKVPERIYTLAQILNTYGYKTAWFGPLKDPHTGSSKGVLNGFNERHDISINCEIIFNWIKIHDKESFFITIHSYAPHEHDFIKRRFNNKFSKKISPDFIGYLDKKLRERWDNFQDMLKQNPDKTGLDKDWIQKHNKDFMQPYSEEIKSYLYNSTDTVAQRAKLENLLELETYLKLSNRAQVHDLLQMLDTAIFDLDKNMISRLLNYLKNHNLYEKTIIIITADHGNEYAEHYTIGHGRRLFDESIHIPLIFYIPNLLKPLRNKELVQSIDILPTVLDLIDIPIPNQAQGISLVGQMECKVNALTNEYVYSLSHGGDLLSIRSKQWKLIHKFNKDWYDLKLRKGLKNMDDSIQEWLFNLQKDKEEKNNLIKKKPKVAQDLRQRLKSKLNSLVVYQEGKSEFVEGLPKETKERIIKTGYW